MLKILQKNNSTAPNQENKEDKINEINQEETVNKEKKKKQENEINQENLNKNFIDIDIFFKVKFIGCGSFGKVFKVKEIATGEIFAAKIISSNFASDYANNNEALNFFFFFAKLN